MFRFARVPLTAAVFLLIAGGAFAADSGFKPGKWEITTTTTAPMFPQPQKRTFTQCVHEEDFIPKIAREGDKHCQIKSKSVTENGVKWTMECPNGNGGEPSRAQGEMTYSGNTMHGTWDLKMQVQGKPLSMLWSMSGRRLGDCDAEKKADKTPEKTPAENPTSGT